MTDTREECARRLTQLASDERFSSRRTDLESLAGALVDQANGSWTGVDLLSAFPTEASITVRHRVGWERVFGLLAGASVFLPVGWTWFTLRSAINAYNDFLAAHTPKETAGQTFLALWTTGFEGRLENYHRFGPMALVSLILIVAAAGAIVLHRLIAERNVAREDEQVHGARRELVVALVSAQRLLNERRTDDPRFLEEAVKRSVRELQDAHAATRTSVEEMSTATAAAVASLGAATGKFVADLNSVSTGLLHQLEPLLQATTRAGETLSQSAGAALTAQEQMAAATAQVRSGLSSALDHFGNAVGESTAQTSSAVQSLTASVDKIAAAKDEWAQALSEGLAANGTSILAVRSSLERFEQVLREHQSTLQAQANDLVRAADLSGQVLGELRERAESNGSGR